MHKLFTATLLFTLSTSLFAQDQVAKNVLDKLKETTKSYKNIVIDFDLTLKDQEMHKKKSGRLELKEEKFRLVMKEQIIINDGETQWIYLTDMNEVQIIQHDPENAIMSPHKLFTIYEKEYNYKYVGTQTERGKHLQIIDLLPEKSNAFIKITLSVDTDQHQLNKITILDKNGGTYMYEVTKFTPNATKLAPFKFNLSDYKDIEVIDLR